MYTRWGKRRCVATDSQRARAACLDVNKTAQNRSTITGGCCRKPHARLSAESGGRVCAIGGLWLRPLRVAGGRRCRKREIDVLLLLGREWRGGERSCPAAAGALRERKREACLEDLGRPVVAAQPAHVLLLLVSRGGGFCKVWPGSATSCPIGLTRRGPHTIKNHRGCSRQGKTAANAAGLPTPFPTRRPTSPMRPLTVPGSADTATPDIRTLLPAGLAPSSSITTWHWGAGVGRTSSRKTTVWS
jgi:hypothetical protein